MKNPSSRPSLASPSPAPSATLSLFQRSNLSPDSPHPSRTRAADKVRQVIAGEMSRGSGRGQAQGETHHRVYFRLCGACWRRGEIFWAAPKANINTTDAGPTKNVFRSGIQTTHPSSRLREHKQLVAEVLHFQESKSVYAYNTNSVIFSPRRKEIRPLSGSLHTSGDFVEGKSRRAADGQIRKRESHRWRNSALHPRTSKWRAVARCSLG